MPQLVGKLVGAVLGSIVYGWRGLLIGLLVGHWFDRSLASVAGSGSGRASDHALQRLFFDAAFTLLGRLAKADGRISESEIRQAEDIIAQLGLSAEHRREAIALFQRGAAPDFVIEETLLPFARACRTQPQLVQLLLSFLALMAHADDTLHEAEVELLKQIANTLGLDPRQFHDWLGMSRAQSHFYGGHYREAPQDRARAVDPVAAAYQALGVDAQASDADVKKAYRRLMSQYHPDKLMARGVPEDMIKLGTQKAQEIQAAYDVIEKARKR